MGIKRRQADFSDLDDRDWRALKDDWLSGVNGYFEVANGGKHKRLSANTMSYLLDVFLHMGNGGKYERGRYAFPASATAQRLGLGGSARTKADTVNAARRDAIDKGFLRELRRGTGGNGYKSKGSVVMIDFEFENGVATGESPVSASTVQGGDPRPATGKSPVNAHTEHEDGAIAATGESPGADSPDRDHRAPATGESPVPATGKSPVNSTGESPHLNKYRANTGESSTGIPSASIGWGEFGDPEPDPFGGGVVSDFGDRDSVCVDPDDVPDDFANWLATQDSREAC